VPHYHLLLLCPLLLQQCHQPLLLVLLPLLYARLHHLPAETAQVQAPQHAAPDAGGALAARLHDAALAQQHVLLLLLLLGRQEATLVLQPAGNLARLAALLLAMLLFLPSHLDDVKGMQLL
jgi:hypothetical protein